MARRKNIPLYHWSPQSRRKQIIRHGLRPSMKPVTTSPDWKAPYICFADSPSWAWALSGGSITLNEFEWDLWQTWLYDLETPRAIRSGDRPSGIYEVRTKVRVPKSKLWHVGVKGIRTL